MRLISSSLTEDARWMKVHEISMHLPYEFLVLNARCAMFNGDVYVPTVFDPDQFDQSGERQLGESFKQENCVFIEFPGFEVRRWFLRCPRRTGPRTEVKITLIYTDGACSNNGSERASAGTAFSLCRLDQPTKGCVRWPLEREGPFGERFQPTSNRAELRAVITALEWRYW